MQRRRVCLLRWNYCKIYLLVSFEPRDLAIPVIMDPPHGNQIPKLNISGKWEDHVECQEGSWVYAQAKLESQGPKS